MSKAARVFAVLLILAALAQGIFAQTATPTTEVEIVGELETLSRTSIVVAGFTFDTTNAEVQRGLAPGDVVKVHATMTATGWQAREVELFVADSGGNAPVATPEVRPEGEFEITGTLTSIQPGLMVIAGETIDVTNAEINSQLVVGEVARAHVTRVNGVLVAREVEAAGFRFAPTCATTTPNGWRTYTVRAGDTLSGIAARARISLAELARVNCIENTRSIAVGATLFVPRAVSNDNDNNSNDNGNDNDDNGNDNDDNGNDNDDRGGDNGNDNDDHGNDNNDDHGNDNDDDHRGGDDNDNHGNDNDDD